MSSLKFEDVDLAQSPKVCRGIAGCGALVMDLHQHLAWHQANGSPVDLSDMPGANDPGPMPPKGDEHT